MKGNWFVLLFLCAALAANNVVSFDNLFRWFAAAMGSMLVPSNSQPQSLPGGAPMGPMYQDPSVIRQGARG